METVLTIIILVIIALLLVLGIIYYKKYKQVEKDPFDEELALKITDCYLGKEELKFYNFMLSNIDSNWKILPKIGVDNILQPTINKNQYNLLMSNYLDFVVFDASYKPLFVIDLVKNSYNKDGMLSKYDKHVSMALEAVKMPVVVIKAADFYIYDEVKASIDEILNPQIVDTNNEVKLNKGEDVNNG